MVAPAASSPAASRLAQRLRLLTEEVTVYPVSCERLAAGRSDLEWLRAVLAGGARIVQLRDKEASSRQLYAKAEAFRRLTSDAGALFIIDDRLDVALAVDADGIHLGDQDLPAEAARRLAPELIIGVSCHSGEDVAAALAQGASYYNIGPIFPTATKTGVARSVGPEAIEAWCRLSPLPFTVMGGIKRDHVPELVRRGARRLAVVTALTQAPDIEAETRALVAAIRSALAARAAGGSSREPEP
ncbi:MAG: thiamine phosphate synthase [Thermodesulfobacteriota bacterium]